MTRSGLRSRTLTKHHITDKCANSHSEHDPAIVRHEQQPFHRISTSMQTVQDTAMDVGTSFELGDANLHDEKGVKDLHGVENRLDDLGLLLGGLSYSPWVQQ